MAPEATWDKKCCRCCSVPTSRTIGVNCVMVGSRGPGATARPSSSTTTAVSTIESADEREGTLLLEKGSDRGAQLFLLGRELELHWPPSPAVPVAVQSICSRS